MKQKALAHPSTASEPEKIDAHKQPTLPAVNEQAQVLDLLKQIVDLLSEIDCSLANIGGKLDDIRKVS